MSEALLQFSGQSFVKLLTACDQQRLIAGFLHECVGEEEFVTAGRRAHNVAGLQGLKLRLRIERVKQAA